MKDPLLILKIGTRSSPLSIAQTRVALRKISAMLPGVSFDLIPMSSPGDEDKKTNLAESDPDFFTRYLDTAVEEGDVDGAIHSAKDLPDQQRRSLEWFWLPWREDPRDVIILRKSESIGSLPKNARIGISSDRRKTYSELRFPEARLLSVRGNIEERISQLDAGKYDVLIMAAAALTRLKLEERIAEWIPLSELQTPPGQGYLAITYRRTDDRMHRIRRLFIKPAVLAGGGPGHPDYCTVACLKALQRCNVCIYDALAPQELLKKLGKEVVKIDAGKRRGEYKIPREELDRLIVDLVRQGKNVLRLKGGDPGIYGRLAEEVRTLGDHNLPYRVIPGVSSLSAATTGTGLLLTRKGTSRGFTVMTPRFSGSGGSAIGARLRTELPLAFFMAVEKTPEIVEQLIQEGRPETEPAAAIFGASTPSQKIVCGCLMNIAEKVKRLATDLPGILFVGHTADSSYLYEDHFAALENKRVLITCSEALQDHTENEVLSFGGIPIKFPLVQLEPNPSAGKILLNIENYDWIVLTSPSAVYSFMSIIRELGIDLRTIPRIIVSGPGVSRVLQEHGLNADAVPKDAFGADAMLKLAKQVIRTDQHVLRLRSQLAGKTVETTLKHQGIPVTDCVLYTNKRIYHDELPSFDLIFFASSSAVRVYLKQWGAASLNGKISIAIGEPTTKAMVSCDCSPTLVSDEPTVISSIKKLAAYCVNEHLNKTPFQRKIE